MLSHSHSHAQPLPAPDGASGGAEAFAAATRAITGAIALNAAFTLVEAVAGFLAHSMALLADAGHNLSDIAALVLALAAGRLALTRSTRRFTYGFKRGSVLIALANVGILVFAMGVVFLEAIQRLRSPARVDAVVVMAVAAAGILVNGASAFVLRRGRGRDLNIRAAFWHLASDALVSLGVVLAGALILVFRAPWIDPAVSLAVAAFVLYGTWGILKEALSQALDAVPGGIDPAQVRAYLLGLDGVAEVHDLHIWGLTASQAILTAHLVVPEGSAGDSFLDGVAAGLLERFGIGHATVQVEMRSEDDTCRLEGCVTERG